MPAVGAKRLENSQTGCWFLPVVSQSSKEIQLSMEMLTDLCETC